MKQAAFVILGLLFSVSAFSGVRDIGNGGAGVIVDGKPVLLDLFEMGLTNGFIENQISPIDEFTKAAQAVYALTKAEQILLAQKLTEIDSISPRAALLLARGLQEYAWEILDVDLNVIPEPSPLKVETVQLANRLGSIIRFQQSYWDAMSSENRVALVLHEIVYAYAPVTPVCEDLGPGLFSKQDSVPVRELIGVLFLESNDRTRYLKESLIFQMFTPFTGFSILNGDRVETFTDVRVNGAALKRTKPTLCEELLSQNFTFPKKVTLTFLRTTEKILVQSYKTPSGRQKNLNVARGGADRGTLIFNLKQQDVFTCEQQVKDSL